MRIVWRRSGQRLANVLRKASAPESRAALTMWRESGAGLARRGARERTPYRRQGLVAAQGKGQPRRPAASAASRVTVAQSPWASASFGATQLPPTQRIFFKDR